MYKKRGNTAGIVIVLALFLAIVTLLNAFLVFGITSNQTKESGVYQLSSIGGELESSISLAKSRTMELALNAKEIIDDRSELSAYITEEKRKLTEETDGLCYNLYIAGSDWDIIPDLEKPEGFIATERDWYIGAIANEGEAYVTNPYIDAWTGNICYSVSVELGDGDTVIGVDYTLDNIQQYIKQITADGNKTAVIVTEGGVIAGCSDESLIGGDIVTMLPDYAGIFAKVRKSDDVVSTRIKSDVMYDNLFATRSADSWYLIVAENDWDLYKYSYMMLGLAIVLNLALFCVIISLYLISMKNQRKAEEALAAKEEFLGRISDDLRRPLRNIITGASIEHISQSENYEEELNKVKHAGEQLSNMVEQILTYSSVSKTVSEKEEHSKYHTKGLNHTLRIAIVLILLITMTVSTYSNISATTRWGHAKMQQSVMDYEDQLSKWINTQKSILDMFCSIISTNPEMLDDYDACVEYLDDITLQYPEISVTYMTNPEAEHTVIMNNGWEPDLDWHVEERQWYIDTLNSENGWSISAPYYDEQTGIYCVTISEAVYDNETGEFLGNFGIDFYMDKLIDILGASYSDEGYAFLADADGEIINHPYGEYQMSVESIANVAELSYKDADVDGETTTIIEDYDGSKRILIAKENKESGFVIYVVNDLWAIYGNLIIHSIASFLIFAICIIVIYSMITKLMKWQDEVNAKLKESADIAIAAGNAKSSFLAQMSHEIRTPINAVLGMNEMILRENANNDIKEYALNIQSAGRTLLALINSILDFSKIEDGKMEIIPVNYDVASMINDLVNSNAEHAKEKSLHFEVKVDESIPSILYGDDVRIRQVITNLLTNAVKYTERGSVTLSFKCMNRTDEYIDLSVAVKDTGIGIKDEDFGKLFESFQRLDEKRNRNIEGTGLGISIVTKLLKLMDSSLVVESEYGKGSEFSFVLRQNIVSNEAIGNYEERMKLGLKKSDSESYLFAPDAEVLLVDDNEMNLKVARGLLKRNSIFPDTAISGVDAIAAVKNKKYDVILLDHMMPGMDGIETMKLMKEQQLITESTVVIALTANAIVGAREEYISAGFDDYLSKPIEIKELEQKLSKYLPASKVSFRKNEESGTTDDIVSATVANQSESDDEELTLSDIRMWHEKCPMINLMTGLEYSGESMEFYLEIIDEFIAGDKREKLNSLFEKEDYANYRITVHALKGTALTIGAEVLSDHARSLEYAARDEDIDFIKKHHEELILEYAKILEALNGVRNN